MQTNPCRTTNAWLLTTSASLVLPGKSEKKATSRPPSGFWQKCNTWLKERRCAVSDKQPVCCPKCADLIADSIRALPEMEDEILGALYLFSEDEVEGSNDYREQLILIAFDRGVSPRN
jgi:hypothetical protein